jgi:hypothetical protein
MAIADFDNALDGFTTIPAGTYLVRIQKYERKKAKTSGNDMIQWAGVVVEGPQMGSVVADFCTLTDTAVWKIAKFIKCASVEITGKLDTDSSKFKTVLDACIGQTMYWSVSQEPKENGQLSNKVEGYAKDLNAIAAAVCPSDMDTPSWAKE